MKPSNIAVPLVAVAVVFLCSQAVQAADLFFAGNGSGTTCSQSAPCLLQEAINLATSTPPVVLSCADSSDAVTGATVSKSLTIDCSGTAGSIDGLTVDNGAVVTLKNFTMGGNTENGIYFVGSGTLIVENVHFIGAIVYQINAQPSSPSRLIVRNCIFDNGGAGIFLKPAAGGSLSVQFDHVIIADNTGGGIKVDTTNGPVTVDITDSIIRDNGGNGVNAVSPGANQNMVSIKNSVIAENGSVGVQVNGANAAILVQTTLFDQNASGATSVIGGGHISTYGNNSIVGGIGSGFTGTASLQ
jgi:hypothetical protein